MKVILKNGFVQRTIAILLNRKHYHNHQTLNIKRSEIKYSEKKLKLFLCGHHQLDNIVDIYSKKNIKSKNVSPITLKKKLCFRHNFLVFDEYYLLIDSFHFINAYVPQKFRRGHLLAHLSIEIFKIVFSAICFKWHNSWVQTKFQHVFSCFNASHFKLILYSKYQPERN